MSQERLTFAVDLARSAGELAVASKTDAGKDFRREKGFKDVVTQADLAVETFLRQEVKKAFPTDGFIGEEFKGTAYGAFDWVVDPIDGTTNYANGFPDWGVSVAILKDGKPLIGVLEFPDLGLRASACLGHGASINGQAVTGIAEPYSKIAMVGHSVRGTLSEHLALIAALDQAGYEYRRQGAASFGLFCVASGMANLFFEAHLSIWDVLAGVVLIEELGGAVAPIDIKEFTRTGGPMLAAQTPEILRQSLDIARKTHTPGKAGSG